MAKEKMHKEKKMMKEHHKKEDGHHSGKKGSGHMDGGPKGKMKEHKVSGKMCG